MPDPVWSYTYNFAGNPASNSFAQIFYGNPGVTFVTSGAPANRRITIDSTSGDCVFQTVNVPALSLTNGATIELRLNVTGVGDAGYELDFLDAAILIQVEPNQLWITLASDTGQQDFSFATAANNVDIDWRATVDASRNLRVYRAGVLVAGPIPVPVSTRPFQRVLFWVEGGAVATIRAVKFYSGGAVAPG